MNLSSRVRVSAGASVLVTGFVIAGTAPKQVILRAVVSGLPAYGVTGTLPNPRLVLYRGANVVHENDDGEASTNPVDLAAATARVGAFPLAVGSKDAAILATLAPGSYTALISDVGGATGHALVEIYDAGATATPEFQRFVSISTRGEVTATDAPIAGFIVTGNTPKRLLIRGASPALAAFAVPSPLADPSLRLFTLAGTLLAQNDDGETAAPLAPGQTATTPRRPHHRRDRHRRLRVRRRQPRRSHHRTLPPGTYTAHVSSATAGNGVALIEVYEIP